ncbi:SDR family NAD(P)-dependent oxidoreductase [Modestobacter sp. I12A-02662]|uniref:NAD-dependent epimerase/dehydratase family protein n=1 Tax=Modestobacter sp. I12A-02662 TaxID=1730496 RepID=UPI0034DE5944
MCSTWRRSWDDRGARAHPHRPGASNWFFHIAGSLVLSVVRGLLITEVLEPRLERLRVPRQQSEDAEEGRGAVEDVTDLTIDDRARRGMRLADLRCGPGRERVARRVPMEFGGRMARVAVTGSSGKLGRVVVDHLLESGWDVVALDRVPSPRRDVVSTVVDLTDFGQAVEALSGIDDRHDGVDALVHLAAVPAPGLVPNAATFANNVTASYNVYSAALRAGVRTIVWASSETVLGLPFDEPPPYLPVDEEYPPRPNSTYSLVKTLEEELARQLCRWHPDLSMTGLRFSNVMLPEEYAAFPGFDADPQLRKWNLWSYIDARDGAQAVRRALERHAVGADVFIIANADTVMSRPSRELAVEVFPGVPVTREVGEHETLLSIDKARRLLGYEPAYSWRDATG